MIVVIIAVPILVAAAMVDRYKQNGIDIGIKQQAIAIEQETIDHDAVKFKESLLKQQDIINSKLSEVSSCLGKHIQWSPVLETLARYLPAKMVMSGLRAESSTVRQKVASKKDPKRTINVTVSKRKLVLDISGTERRDYGNVVESYKNRLKTSPVLRTKLEDIEVSQNPGRSGDENTVSYTMNLMFKSEAL
jgi:hypothetical protein